MKLYLSLLVGTITAITVNSQIIDKANGKAYKRIIIDAKAPSSVRLAASDLKKYLKAVCKTDLSVETKSAEKTGNIYVGLSHELKKHGFTLKGLKSDGFRIINKNGNLYIFGRDYSGPPVYGIRNPWRACEVYNSKLKIGAFGEAGTLYGVYYFLEKFAGIRWYMPGDLGTVIPESGKIEIPAVEISRFPDFSYRYPWICDFNQAPDNALWFRRAGFGGPYPVQIIHSFNFFKFKGYPKTHPEYFALVDGKRDFDYKCASAGGGNLCLTSPAVKKQWVENICAYFKAHPEQGVYPLAPNDGLTRICGCRKCQAEIDHKAPSSGKFSNHVWGFVNKVAKEVAKKYPDKMIGCIAYEHYLDPPSNIRKLSPNVAVMICKWRSNFIMPSYKKIMRARIEKWRKKCKNVYCWEYYLQTWMPWRNLPIVFPHIISEDLQYLKKINCAGEFTESESWYGNRPHKILFPGMQHLNLYVTAKLYWDADQDVDKLLDEYFRLFYGPAEKEMKKFWLLAEKIRVDAGKNKVAMNPPAVFPKSALDQLSSLLAAAEQKTKPGTVYNKRVKLVANEFKAGRRTILQVFRKGPPTLTVPETANRGILTDGVLSEGIYKKLTPQIFVDKTGEAAAYKTYLYAAHDAENLYFAFINYEPEIKKLKTRSTRRDQDMLWNDDCIEIYLCPNPKDRGKCYQFIVTAKGVVWDGRYGFNKDGRPEISWNSNIKARTQVQRNRWIMEVKIPLKDIGLTAASKEIAANFYRCRVASGAPMYSCWSPIVQDRHFTPGRFGLLKLTGKKK